MHQRDSTTQGAATLQQDGKHNIKGGAELWCVGEEEEFAQCGHHGLGRLSETHPRSDGRKDHEHKSTPICFLASKAITQPSEEELSTQGPAERDAVDGSRDVGG